MNKYGSALFYKKEGGKRESLAQKSSACENHHRLEALRPFLRTK